MSSVQTIRGLTGLIVLAGVALTSSAKAQNCDCKTDCCPPYFKYRFEGAPKIKFKHGCPKPICDPCNLPHYGYFQTCWQPWPFPPNWDHCPVPPPAALVQPIPPKRFRQETPMEEKEKENEGPPPRRTDNTNPNPNKEGTPSAALPMFSVETKPAPERKPVEQVKVVVEEKSIPEVKPTPEILSMPQKPAPEVLTMPEVMPMKEVKLPVEEKPLTNAKAHSELPPVPTQPMVERQPMKESPSPYMPKPVAPSVLAPLPGIEEPSSVPPMPQSQEKPVEATVKRPRTTTNAAPAMRMVNSRRIMLDYEMADVPAGQNSMLELWYTQDGRNWQKDPTQIKSGAPYVVDVGKEGTYGFMLVARGPAERSTPPSPGETPQVWVEVDWTKPLVNLIDVKAAQGPMGRNVSIVWSATDNNLSEKPITLSYAENPQGPWTTFATGIENTGRFVWQVPNNVSKYVFLRVEAFDLVGNTGVVSLPTGIQLP